MSERDSRRRLLHAGARAGAGLALSRAAPAGLAALAAPGSALAATIVAVRVWPARDYTRVALELDAPLRSTQMQLSDPPRVVVDLEGLAIDLALRELIAKIQPDDPYIARVRIGQNQPTVARLVFDLKQDVAPQLFALPPVGEYRHRLVLDLYPARMPDPLAALLDRNSPRHVNIAAMNGTKQMRSDEIAELHQLDAILLPHCPETASRLALRMRLMPELEQRQAVALTPCHSMALRRQ